MSVLNDTLIKFIVDSKYQSISRVSHVFITRVPTAKTQQVTRVVQSARERESKKEREIERKEGQLRVRGLTSAVPCRALIGVSDFTLKTL